MEGRPLVKAPLPRPTVDHATLTMDVTFTVDPGPKVGFGEVSISGPKRSIPRSSALLSIFGKVTPIRQRRSKIRGNRSARSQPSARSASARGTSWTHGNLPIFVEVGDRARNLIGFTAGYSTMDGPTGSVYYENRNLFGGAETLRFEGDVFYAPPIYGILVNSFNGFTNGQNFNNSGLGARLTLGFVKPASMARASISCSTP